MQTVVKVYEARCNEAYCGKKQEKKDSMKNNCEEL